MWHKKVAITIGIAFSVFFLVFFIPETIDRLMGVHSPLERGITLRDVLLLGCGQFSLLAATVLAFWRPKIAGWWMLVGGATVAAILGNNALHDARPKRFLVSLLFSVTPMIIAGILLVIAGRKKGQQNATAEGSRYHRI